jgi:tetratricopeptide (TPR) repeat protein
MLKILHKTLGLWRQRQPALTLVSNESCGDQVAKTFSAKSHFDIGVAARKAGKVQEALASFERALEIRTNYAEALVQQGELLADISRHEDAADSFTLALAHDAGLAAAWAGYGKLLRLGGRIEEAILHLERAATLAPASVDVWLALALALNEAGQTDQAAAAYERAIEAAPDQPAAYVNLGLLCLSQRGDPDRAEMLFRRAVELAPHRVEPQANLGLALHEQGRSDEALAHYDALIAKYPECAEYRWHRGCARLSTGDYAGGWDDHEARKLRDGRWRRPLPFSEWDGRAETARQLLVYAEQGIGDEIMFASCLPDVLQVAQHCVIECDARVASLFQRSFPDARVHGVDRTVDDLSWLTAYPEPTAQCAIGSLPRYFRRSADEYRRHNGYLVANREQLGRWRDQLAGMGEGLKIGVAWRGGTYKTRRELRSTTLSQWQPVFSQTGARFFALQSASSEEWQELSHIGGAALHPLSDSANDFDELAALIASLDLIITVQGTTVHLAGAQNRPVWVLLNRSAEWRYMASGQRMPWYPSARLFRQPISGAWDTVFQDVARALNALICEPRILRAMPT